MPKDKSKDARRGAVPLRESLEAQLASDERSKVVSGGSSKRRSLGGAGGGHGGAETGEEAEERFVPAKLTQKILRQAREQQREEAAGGAAAAGAGYSKRTVRFHAAGGAGGAHDDDDDDDEEDGGAGGGWHGAADGNDDDEEEVAFGAEDEVEVAGEYVHARGHGAAGAAGEDAAILRRFMPDEAAGRRTLADIILEKLAEREAAQAQGAAGGAAGGPGQDGQEQGPGAGLDPKVVQVYSDVGKYLSTYKSGKLPKVLKVIPSLARWEEVLFLTNPESWTPHATYAATRVFASNLNAAKAQRFYNLILLPKVRDDIFLHKKLNFHLYLAMRKATYKPAAFYRGILLPLAAGGDCTLLEAIIVSSVVKKSSIPQLHSAAALVKLAGLPYSGAVSVFLSALLDKKYTLPYLALDAVVEHFCGFRDVPGPLPVLWHTSLLSLARRYKGDLTAEQKTALRQLMGVHGHLAISAEVRRELAAAPCRGEGPLGPVPGAAAGGAGAGAAAGGVSASAGAGFAASAKPAGGKGKAGGSAAGAGAGAAAGKGGRKGPRGPDEDMF